jgi:ThiF family
LVEESGHVLVRDIPYVTPAGVVSQGVLVSPLNTSGDATAAPADHTAWFVGEAPSDRDGQPLRFHSPMSTDVGAGLTVSFQLSAKDPELPTDPDYYVKFTRYVRLLEAHAQSLDPTVDARTFRPVADEDAASPFMYLDSASSRAGISGYATRLEQERVAIVGLGGTGSYVLDLLAKTRIGELHLFDGDDLLSHNAFRAPGAASLEELNARPKKVDYYAQRYGVLKRGLFAHPYFLDHTNAAAELADMGFVFLCMEGGGVKRALVEALEELELSFIDVAMDVQVMADALGGSVQVTTSTPGRRDHFRRRVSFGMPTDDDLYSANIQVADLNCLNATLAVIKWKKLRGFYFDQGNEHYTAYGLDTNMLVNEEQT